MSHEDYINDLINICSMFGIINYKEYIDIKYRLSYNIYNIINCIDKSKINNNDYTKLINFFNTINSQCNLNYIWKDSSNISLPELDILDNSIYKTYEQFKIEFKKYLVLLKI